MRQHDKIINEAAKKILAPHGLFRQGTSRTWLDDNGYFMVIVAFESSSWSQGSYLGVGVDFLWEKSEELNRTLVYSCGGRVKEFCQYGGDGDAFQKEFREKMEQYAKTALQKVEEYRKLKNLDYAQKYLSRKLSATPQGNRFWEVYELAMLCFLKGDFGDGMVVFEYFLEILKGSFYVGDVFVAWHKIFYQHCIDDIKPCLTSKSAAQNMVLDMIKRRRDFFREKSSFRKMKEETFCPVPERDHES